MDERPNKFPKNDLVSGGISYNNCFEFSVSIGYKLAGIYFKVIGGYAEISFSSFSN
jgi:hypothetical protein